MMDKNCKKNAFSLAEAMVMLVVISILLAVSAPLIAKKSNADQRRLVVQSGVNPVTAMGNNQNFGVGQNNPTAKLEVRGNDNTWRKVARFVSTISGNGNFDMRDAGGVNNTPAHDVSIFEVIPGDHAANPNGFKVFADGTTNVKTCVPDYNRDTWTSINTYQVCNINGVNTNCYVMNPVPDDGYIIATRSVLVDGVLSAYPTMVPKGLIYNNANVNVDGVAGANVNVHHYNYMGYVIVPVVKNNIVYIFRDQSGLNPTRDSSGESDQYPVNSPDFPKYIPCANPTR